jgi:hypothetical protein
MKDSAKAEMLLISDYLHPEISDPITEGQVRRVTRPCPLSTSYLGVTRKMPHNPFVNWKLSCVR